MAYRLSSGWKFDINGAYTHAYLTQATPTTVGGLIGDRLPATPLFQGFVGAEYQRRLFGSYSGFAGVDWRLSGSRYAGFGTARQEMPSYEIVDLRTGIETQKWSCTLYIKNVGNSIVINNVGAQSATVQVATVNTPRTIGLALTANF